MSLAVAYGMKKRKKMADGGDSKKEWEGNKSPRGGYMHPKRPNDKEKMDPDTGEISSSDSRESEYLHEVREGNRKEQAERQSPKRPLKGLAHGGSADEGPSEKANQYGVHKIVPNFDREHSEVKHGQSEARYGSAERKKEMHQGVLSELRSMPKPKLADGGPIDELMEYDPMEEPGVMPNESAMMEDDRMQDKESDLVDRIIKKMSEGGMIANGGDEDPETHPGSLPNEFDDLALRDDLSFSYTGANSGDEKGDQRLDDDNDDIVSRILRSRAKKDRLPNPR